MTRSEAATIVGRFGRQRVLVVGDLILDEFIWGNVSRISPEAPVPVVEVTGETALPGGAANVARNLREFTGQVLVAGRVGDDDNGGRLVGLLREADIQISGVCVDRTTPTAVKTRILARHQQVVRIDREKRRMLSEEAEQEALQLLESWAGRVDAVIVADYNKGLVTPAIAERLSLMAVSGTLLAVDPHPGNRLNWHQATVIKPNHGEAYALLGRRAEPLPDGGPDESLRAAGAALLEGLGGRYLLVTLGEHGMMLFSWGRPPFHVPTRAREVFDVSGAGDTAIALFTLAMLSGATAEEAAVISNHASGVVVGKLGTATLTPEELLESFE